MVQDSGVKVKTAQAKIPLSKNWKNLPALHGRCTTKREVAAAEK
jgi:hypothetical protein